MEAQAAYDRLVHFIETMAWLKEQAAQKTGAPDEVKSAFSQAITSTREKFESTMDDDFNTAGALGAIFELMKAANSFYSDFEKELDARDLELLAHAGEISAELLEALGVEVAHESDAHKENYPGEVIALAENVCGAKPANAQLAIDMLLEARQTARAEKNWGIADSVRDGLAELGFTIEDTSAGSRVLFSKE